MSIVVTGATGHLGRHVVEQLLQKVPADQVTAVVRTPEKAADLAERGVKIAVADYNAPETFDGLFTAGDKVLLISGNEFGKGRVSSASRADYAAAAVAVLTGEGHENKTYELGGDVAWSFAEYAAELSRQTGKDIGSHPVS